LRKPSLSSSEYGRNDLKFSRAHNKMNNIWAKLHKLEGDEVELDFVDYSVVSSNENVVPTLKEGLKEA